MKKQLVFASNNEHKLFEIAFILQNTGFEVLSMNTIGCFDTIPETGNTLIENALQKARYLHQKYQIDCFADDSGLEIVALNGEPGVHSAHYSGTRNQDENMNLVLLKLHNENYRIAFFKTVIALIINDKEYIFEGVVEGEIVGQKIGEQGFGYDPIFQPKGWQKTFAQATMEEKNEISHRKKALQQMLYFLKLES